MNNDFPLENKKRDNLISKNDIITERINEEEETYQDISNISSTEYHKPEKKNLPKTFTMIKSPDRSNNFIIINLYFFEKCN